MLQDVLDLQERFEPWLDSGHYTFIGPVDESLLEPFMRRVNDLAPIVAISRELYHFMGNKAAVEESLKMFPPELPLRIYVVRKRASNIMLHDTIAGYCERNGIQFQP